MSTKYNNFVKFDLNCNFRYETRLSQLSKIASDQPMSALDKAVWWIEYVIRHDGAVHLRYPGIEMPFYQYFLLDVIAFFFAVFVTFIYIFKRIWKHVVLCYHVFRRALTYFLPRRTHVD